MPSRIELFRPLTMASPGSTEIIDAWLSAKSPDTVKNYTFDFQRFAAFLGVKTIPEACGVLFGQSQGNANALVFRYRASLIKAGLAPTSINRHLASLTSLVKIARMMGIVVWGLDVPRLRVQAYRDTTGPGRNGFLTLMQEAVDAGGARGARDQMVLRLLYERGLRIKEVVELKLEHVDFGEDRVSIMGKGRIEREWVTIAPATMEAIAAWLRHRGTKPGPLACRVHAGGNVIVKQLSRQSGYRLVRKLGEAVGIRARPHGLRHAAITAALDAGADIRAVQKFSRHKNIQTVLTYDDNRRDLGGQVARLIAIEIPKRKRGG